jgi:hypothetical protein
MGRSHLTFDTVSVVLSNERKRVPFSKVLARLFTIEMVSPDLDQVRLTNLDTKGKS